jgi:hypothetical protein
MDTTNDLRPNPTASYPDDIAYLEEELMWLRARIDSRPEFRTKEQSRLIAASAPRYARLLRMRIERRLAATREAGIVLGLDRVTTCNGLDGFERLILIASIAPVLRPDFEVAYRVCGAAMGLCPEILFELAGLDLRERVARRSEFTNSGKLIKAGLITCDLPASSIPSDLSWATVAITEQAFKAITGADAEARRAAGTVGRVASVLELYPVPPPDSVV